MTGKKTRVLLTRLGGVGDLFFLEPVIRTLHEKYAPCEIVFRTYKDYHGVFDYHPLVSAVVYDSNEYSLGYFNHSLEALRPDLWGNVDSRFDHHFDFQGVIEKGTERPDYNFHVTNFCGEHAGVFIEDIVPQIHYLKKNVPKYDVVAQLVSAERHRSLNENTEILKSLLKYNTYLVPSSKELGFQEFISIINNCKVFIGTESCGSIIARGLNKPIVAFFQTERRRRALGYDRMRTLMFSEVSKFNNILKETWDKSKIF